MKHGDLVGWVVVLCILVAGALYATSQPALDAPDSLFTAIGNVRFADRLNRSTAEFRFGRRDCTYLVSTSDPAVLEALRASQESGNRITAQVHAHGAAFAGGSADSTFWVESFNYRGKRYGPFEETARWSWRRLSSGDESLLRALGALSDEHYGDAEQGFTAALDAGLNAAREARALEGRAESLESLAYPPGREINADDDALLVRASADYRRAAELNPHDPDLLLSAAYALRSLGAYSEALALYDEAGKRFPDRYFRIAISRGSTARQLGNYEQALHELDELVARHGPQAGMMYHYHRAITLIRLERFTDAVAESSAGLESQPDFGWAFIARACAESRLQQLETARSDLERALRVFRDQERLVSSDYLRHSIADVTAVHDTLAVGTPCELFGREPGERHRERSAQLR